MIRKKIQVTVSGGIHLAIAVSLSQLVKRSGTHVFLKSGKKMVTAREVQKILSLGVHYLDWVELIVDGEEEESITEQIKKLLSSLR